MYETFESLPQEKKDCILNSAYCCFAKNGYEKTSISDIAKASGISKASIFHYFSSKPNLYLYLYNMSMKVIIGGVAERLKNPSSDLFERMLEAQEHKIEVITQYLGMYDFLSGSFNEQSSEIRPDMDQINERYKGTGYELLLEGIDWSRFKPGINTEMVINTIDWMGEGYIKQATKLNKSLETMTKEIYEYMDFIKQSMYKEEFL